MLAPMTEDFRCAVDSLARDEQLIGSAPHVTHWLLLQYEGAWGNDAAAQSDLPDAVKAYLDAFAARYPQHKILLIKGGGSSDRKRVYYIEHVQLGRPNAYAFDLDAYEELLAIDFEDAAQLDGHRHTAPFLTVCTNGKRDQCCALTGLPAWNALSAMDGIEAWQSTHVGQHRLAPNVIQFPQGIYHGRVDDVHMADFVAAFRAGEVNLATLRGSTELPRAAQVAEYFLREHTGDRALDAISACEVQDKGEGAWQVQLTLAGQPYSVAVREEKTGVLFYAACDADKASEESRWQLDGIELSENG